MDQETHERLLAQDERFQQMKRTAGAVGDYVELIADNLHAPSRVLEAFVTQASVYAVQALNDARDIRGGDRSAFNDLPRVKGVNSVDDLLSKFRNAANHVYSESRVDGHIVWNFGMIVGRQHAPQWIQIGRPAEDEPWTVDYEDDVAFIYGPYRIYLYRHLRAIGEQGLELARQGLMDSMEERYRIYGVQLPKGWRERF